jgi:hypothetical protein
MAKRAKEPPGLIPVSERALLQRINRKLAKSGEMVRKSRTERLRLDVGDYFLVDTNKNAVVGHSVNLEEKGRELGVLSQWERLEQ